MGQTKSWCDEYQGVWGFGLGVGSSSVSGSALENAAIEGDGPVREAEKVCPST